MQEAPCHLCCWCLWAQLLTQFLCWGASSSAVLSTKNAGVEAEASAASAGEGCGEAALMHREGLDAAGR